MGTACSRRGPTPPIVAAAPAAEPAAESAPRHTAAATSLSSIEHMGPKEGDCLKQDGCAALQDFLEEVRDLERRRRDSTRAAAEALRTLFGPEARLVKSASIDGRLLFVVDGAVPKDVHSDLFGCLQTDAFRRTEFARPDTRDFRHHVVEYSPEKLRRTELFVVVARLVRLLFPMLPLEVYRIYTNAVMYGDAAFVHRDSSDSDHVTVLVYPNPEWASELGGETVFYSEDKEIADAVEPRPGRICLFHGNILHKGSPPSRLFWGSRYTTAFKFAPREAAPPPAEQSAAAGSGAPDVAAGSGGGRLEGRGGAPG
mmetsp:Transcript_57305/g.179531  ORF Transcript_57305/g.179531 Transcript_57305/m.179531 type:complete len:313 (-) Transcript_57305:194-1132(-)